MQNRTFIPIRRGNNILTLCRTVYPAHKRMKRKIATAAVASACIMMLATGSVYAANNMEGNWYGNYKGMPITLSLQTENVFSLSAGEDSIGGSYNETGTWSLSDDGNTITLTGEDNEDVLECDDSSITFIVNEQPVELTGDVTALQGYIPAKQNLDATTKDMEGVWRTEHSTSNGYTLGSDITGIVSYCEIEGNIAHIYLHTNDADLETAAEDIACNAGRMTGSYVYDGETVENYVMYLLEDGKLWLKISYDDGNKESDMYMVKSTKEEMEKELSELKNKKETLETDDTTKSASELVGTWTGTMSKDANPVDLTLTLKDDGSYKYQMDEVTENGTWEERDGAVFLNASIVSHKLKYDGSSLTSEEDNVEMAKAE